MRKHLQTSKVFSIGVVLLFTGGLGLLHAPTASAQTQAEMNQTAAADYTKADKEMAAAYIRLKAKLGAKQKKQLTTAQQAWIKFRDAEAMLLSSKVEGGSAYPMVYSGNLTTLTRQRTAQLKAAYKRFTTEGEL